MELRSVETLIRALNAACVRCYLLVGGLAVNTYGFSGLTSDVDIVLHLEPDNARRGLRALVDAAWRPAIPATAEDFLDPSTRARWREEKGMIVLKLWSEAHPRTSVVIFLFEPFDFEREWLRAERIELSVGLPVPVVSLPALIEMKCAAGRPLDLADVHELTRLR